MNLFFTNIISAIFEELEVFFKNNPQIQTSHGFLHVKAVHNHAVKAINCLFPPLPSVTSMEIQAAALLHDVDDYKYFGEENKNKPNARLICIKVGILPDSIERILDMIQWVGCSENGNTVPPVINESKEFFRLIPRWADRLEAVGEIGVVRCYQYGREKNRPLFSKNSPRATTIEQVFELATQERFSKYLLNGGKSEDMISHYYDKLLHIACPPSAIVCNSYLEEANKNSLDELIKICLHYGKTGEVDVDYIIGLEKKLME